MWYREAMTSNGECVVSGCYEYILNYVDDILCISEKETLQIANQHIWLVEPSFLYRLKDVGLQQDFLVQRLGNNSQLDDRSEAWFIFAEEYLENAIPVIEETYGPLKALFKIKMDAPASPDYHP